MMLTTLNLMNAIPTNNNIKHAIEQTQIIKNHHSITSFASTAEKNCHSLSRRLKRQTHKPRQLNFESRQPYDAQTKSAAQDF